MRRNLDLLKLTYPVTNGIVTDLKHMERIWRHTFRCELDVEPKDHPVLFTEPPLNPKENREKTTEIMFEKFDIPAICVSNQSAMSLFASGIKNGITVKYGHGVGHVVPIYEGYVLRDATLNIDIGGAEVTKFMERIIGQKCSLLNVSFYKFCGTEVARDIKEKHAYVARDYQRDMPCVERYYYLPDGEMLTVGSELFRSPEILFQPSLVDMNDSTGIHETTHNSIMMCDADIRKELYRNIVLSGGSTMFPGFVDRMTREISTYICGVGT